MSVNPIPAGYPTVSPHLIVREAAKAIEFYKTVFGATERMRMAMPGGNIGHAELRIGSSVVMLADECPDWPVAKSPESIGGSPVSLHVYVTDSDAVFANAIASGAKQIRPVATQFYGDRSGAFSDPFGHLWNVSTHVEDVSPEECARRMAAMGKPKS
jgi:PhnB protein